MLWPHVLLSKIRALNPTDQTIGLRRRVRNDYFERTKRSDPQRVEGKNQLPIQSRLLYCIDYVIPVMILNFVSEEGHYV